MKHLLPIAFLVLMLAASCGEKKSPLDAEARDSGMRAAAALVAVDHTDTMSMERAVMDACRDGRQGQAERLCLEAGLCGGAGL